MRGLTKCHSFLTPRVRVPFLTLILVALNIGVYLLQSQDQRALQQLIHEFCDYEIVAQPQLTSSAQKSYWLTWCRSGMTLIYNSEDRYNALLRVVNAHPPAANISAQEYFIQTQLRFQRLVQLAPKRSLTQRLQYQAGSYNLLSLLQANLAHADLTHLSFNMLHFVIFAALVECLRGWRFLLASTLTIAIFSHLLYTWVFGFLGIASETIGFSGVSMGIMALAAVLIRDNRATPLPLWLFVQIWILVFAFTTVNIYAVLPLPSVTKINVVVHAAAIIVGLVIGFVDYRRSKQRVERQL